MFETPRLYLKPCNKITKKKSDVESIGYFYCRVSGQFKFVGSGSGKKIRSGKAKEIFFAGLDPDMGKPNFRFNQY